MWDPAHGQEEPVEKMRLPSIVGDPMNIFLKYQLVVFLFCTSRMESFLCFVSLGTARILPRVLFLWRDIASAHLLEILLPAG